MLATKQFKATLGLIRKYDDSMKSALSACYAYTLWQWHNGKNKNPLSFKILKKFKRTPRPIVLKNIIKKNSFA